VGRLGQIQPEIFFTTLDFSDSRTHDFGSVGLRRAALPTSKPRSPMTRSSSRPKNAASPQDGDQHGLRSPSDAWPRGATQASEPESTMRPADAADYIAQMTVELGRVLD
jgi:hypothetical protein